MIGKTTAAAGAVTQSIRKAISPNPTGSGFAAALQEQRTLVDAARTASQATAASEVTARRVPVGARGVAAEAAATQETETLAGRTPLGNRTTDSSDAGRTPVMPNQTEPPSSTSDGGPRPNLSTADVVVNTTGTLSDDPRTEGMYVPPDFYHGNSYSPVFDQKDENGNMVRTPRFEGQVIYSDWRGSLPEDFDPNARVLRDPQTFGNTPSFWQKNDDGSWTRRETGYGGIPLYSNGKPVFTPDPKLYPEYFKV